LHAIVLICEHSNIYEEVRWAHDSKAWNNLVFRALKDGYSAQIFNEEKLEILKTIRLVDDHILELPEQWKSFEKLDMFFFAILENLHHRYQKENQYLDSLMGQPMEHAPVWDNFNLHQQEQHLKQLEIVTN
jgi:hypothetical protein